MLQTDACNVGQDQLKKGPFVVSVLLGTIAQQYASVLLMSQPVQVSSSSCWLLATGAVLLVCGGQRWYSALAQQQRTHAPHLWLHHWPQHGTRTLGALELPYN
jgi:hypothetical protein